MFYGHLISHDQPVRHVRPRIMSGATPHAVQIQHIKVPLTIVLRSACTFSLQKSKVCVVIAVYSVAVEHIVGSLSKSLTAGTVTVIWVSPCFGYPHTQIPSEMGIPPRDTQNTDSYTDKRLEEAKVILDIKIVFFMPLNDRQPLLISSRANMNCTIAK